MPLFEKGSEQQELLKEYRSEITFDQFADDLENLSSAIKSLEKLRDALNLCNGIDPKIDDTLQAARLKASDRSAATVLMNEYKYLRDEIYGQIDRLLDSAPTQNESDQ